MEFLVGELRESHLCSGTDSRLKNDKTKILPLTLLIQSRPVRRELNDDLNTEKGVETGNEVMEFKFI
jgi:hypothetical protein